MTNLLAALAARAAGTEAAISPVVGSMFDPPGMGAAGGALLEEALEEVVARPRRDEPAIMRGVAPTPPARPQPGSTAAHPVGSPGRVPPSPAVPPAPGTAAPSATAPERPADIAAQAATQPRRTVAHRGGPAGRQTSATAEQPESAGQAETEPPKRTAVSSTGESPGTSHPLEPAPDQARGPARASARRAERHAPLASPPSPAPPIPSPAARPPSPVPPSLETADETVVSVTIGRVELRSVTPASRSPQRPVPAARSFPSLEEYLQRTSEGYR